GRGGGGGRGQCRGGGGNGRGGGRGRQLGRRRGRGRGGGRRLDGRGCGRECGGRRCQCRGRGGNGRRRGRRRQFRHRRGRGRGGGRGCLGGRRRAGHRRRGRGRRARAFVRLAGRYADAGARAVAVRGRHVALLAFVEHAVAAHEEHRVGIGLEAVRHQMPHDRRRRADPGLRERGEQARVEDRPFTDADQRSHHVDLNGRRTADGQQPGARADEEDVRDVDRGGRVHH